MNKFNCCLQTKRITEYCNEEVINHLLLNGNIGIIGYGLFLKLETGEFEHETFLYSSPLQVKSEKELSDHISLIEDIHADGFFRITLYADLINESPEIFKTRDEYLHIIISQHDLQTFEIEYSEDEINDNIHYVIQQQGENAATQRIRQRVNTSLNYDIEYNFDMSGKAMTLLFMPYFKLIVDAKTIGDDNRNLDIINKFNAGREDNDPSKLCYHCYHEEGQYALTLKQVSSIISDYKNGIEDKLMQLRIPRAKVIFCVNECF
ncbi:hypothetical protein M5X11_08045 [Paenibacillus alginolyticus]|uniref:hypothetical protein n=1 Tax=Paenibacillus alginolyticus TaxID=59839 RepID=UPI0003F566FD|nr:hypothetical protein [Paenibacillus alginolyticus]MCY9664908.1 hypothetical protein [Paenibacillus alginolyticus]